MSAALNPYRLVLVVAAVMTFTAGCSVQSEQPPPDFMAEPGGDDGPVDLGDSIPHTTTQWTPKEADEIQALLDRESASYPTAAELDALGDYWNTPTPPAPAGP